MLFFTNTLNGFTKFKKHNCFTNVWIVQTIQNSIAQDKIWTVDSCRVPVKEFIFSKGLGLEPATLLNIISPVSTFWRFKVKFRFKVRFKVISLPYVKFQEELLQRTMSLAASKNRIVCLFYFMFVHICFWETATI